MDLAWKDPAENIRRMSTEIRSRLAAHPGVDPRSLLFVFPELTLTGFVTGDPRTSALSRDSREVQAVLALARELGTAIVFGFPEPAGDRVRNTLLFAGPGGDVVASFQKLHLFTQGKPSEAETYECGDQPVMTEYRGWKLGFGVCFDLRFPELFQNYAAQDVELIVLPACWVGGPTKSDQFQTLSRAHAILCRSFFAAVNRTGRDPNFSYEGEALVYGPRGEVLGGEFPARLDPELFKNCPLRLPCPSRLQ